MQGFILKITKSVREDLIVKILSPSHYYTLYRFYGARHSIIFTGRKIDFEVEYQSVYMPKLRNILHLSREYERDIAKVSIWQSFCSLLDKHLDGDMPDKDVPSFYFDVLDSGSKMLSRQSAKRVAVHIYLRMLEFEGRLYSRDMCFICASRLGSDVALTQGFLLACPSCIISPILVAKKRLQKCFHTKSLINLDDKECEKLYGVMGLGL